MELQQFMQALLRQAQLTPNGLADRMENRAVQTLVHRILEGKTTNPRWQSIQPIAKFFDVPGSAFFDAEQAEAIAKERGWLNEEGAEVSTLVDGPEDAVSSATGAVVKRLPLNKKRPMSVFDLAVQMATAMQHYDASARRAAASLMADLALDPEAGEVTATRLSRLLGEWERGAARPSTSTR